MREGVFVVLPVEGRSNLQIPSIHSQMPLQVRYSQAGPSIASDKEGR